MLEADADVVILLHRPFVAGQDEPPSKILAIVAKNRNGPTGEVELYLEPSQFRFENAESEGAGRS